MHSVVVSICETYPITNFNSNATDAGFLAACVGQENVLGFEVTVDDTLVVENTHGCCDLHEEDPQCVLPQSTLSWNNKSNAAEKAIPPLHTHSHIPNPLL